MIFCFLIPILSVDYPILDNSYNIVINAKAETNINIEHEYNQQFTIEVGRVENFVYYKSNYNYTIIKMQSESNLSRELGSLNDAPHDYKVYNRLK